MADDERAVMAAMARRFYLDDVSKTELAAEFAVSRFRVARLLQQARELGVVTIPAPIGKNEALKEILSEVHELLAFGFLGLIAVHMAAALKHHFVDRDLTLVRILPQRTAHSVH